MLFASGILLVLSAFIFLWIGITATIGAFRWNYHPLILYGAGLSAFGITLLFLARALFQQTISIVPIIPLCGLAITCLIAFQSQGGWGDLTTRGLTLQRFLLIRRLPEHRPMVNKSPQC